MININEVLETNKMIEQENLDVRTITLGISLLDCIDSDLEKLKVNIYDKITGTAKDLVAVGKAPISSPSFASSPDICVTSVTLTASTIIIMLKYPFTIVCEMSRMFT